MQRGLIRRHTSGPEPEPAWARRGTGVAPLACSPLTARAAACRWEEPWSEWNMSLHQGRRALAAAEHGIAGQQAATEVQTCKKESNPPAAPASSRRKATHQSGHASTPMRRVVKAALAMWAVWEAGRAG